MQTYYKDLQKALQRIDQEKNTNDIKNFVIDVHGVKSSSAGIGALELSTMAKELELAGKEQRLDFIESHYENFVYKAKEVVENIKEFFGEESTGIEEQKTTDAQLHTLDQEWIKAMVDACDNMDSQSIAELIETLKDKTYNEVDSKTIQQIIEYASQYDYDEIIALF